MTRNWTFLKGGPRQGRFLRYAMVLAAGWIVIGVLALIAASPLVGFPIRVPDFTIVEWGVMLFLGVIGAAVQFAASFGLWAAFHPLPSALLSRFLPFRPLFSPGLF